MKQTEHEKVWNKIIMELGIDQHDFSKSPFHLDYTKVGNALKKLETTATVSKEMRIIFGETDNNRLPKFLIDNNLFHLPTSNQSRVIIKGNGSFSVPEILNTEREKFKPPFTLEAMKIGKSEGMYIDYAHASGILDDFLKQEHLILVTRGRKRLQEPIGYKVYGHQITTKGDTQIEVDAGYENENQLILIEAKGAEVKEQLIRQIYFPFRKWQAAVSKKVRNIYCSIDKSKKTISLYECEFADPDVYESIHITKSKKYIVSI